MVTEDLIKALSNKNVIAFLRVVRHGETTQDDQAYRWLFGSTAKSPKLFDSFADHPRVRTYEKYDGQFIKNGKLDFTTAAGAYQIVASTWDPIAKKYGFKDFSPQNQDLAAVALIAGRNALADITAGLFAQAVEKCKNEWASLPGSTYGQPTKSFEEARAVYEQYGGTYKPQAEIAQVQPDQHVERIEPPIEAKSVLSRIGDAMNPFLMTALSSVIGAVPDLMKIFGSGSEVSDRNIKAAETVVGIAKAAVGAANEQELVEAMSNPATSAAVKQAVQDNWFAIQEVGGGITAARDFNVKLQGDKPLWMNPALWVSAALIPLVYFVVIRVLIAEGFSDEIRIMVVTATMSGVLGAITGFWLGSSASSQRKDEIRK